MKFPRSAKILHGQFDAAPIAGVFFLLVIFVLLGSLVYTPGVNIQLPGAADLPGTEQATVSVAVDKSGKFYFDNQLTTEVLLESKLTAAVKKSAEPLTLLVQADKAVSYETLIRLALLARSAGVKQALLATAPQTSAQP